MFNHIDMVNSYNANECPIRPTTLHRALYQYKPIFRVDSPAALNVTSHQPVIFKNLKNHRCQTNCPKWVSTDIVFFFGINTTFTYLQDLGQWPIARLAVNSSLSLFLIVLSKSSHKYRYGWLQPATEPRTLSGKCDWKRCDRVSSLYVVQLSLGSLRTHICIVLTI